MSRAEIAWSMFLVFAGVAIIVSFGVLFSGCARPPAQPSAVPPIDAQAALCFTAPVKIYYGSCGGKLAPGPATCVLCDGARGCTAYSGVYCVGDAACDDVACK